MRIDSPAQVATLAPDTKPAPIPAPPQERSTAPQTERAVREPPKVEDLPPRESRGDSGGGVDILV